MTCLESLWKCVLFNHPDSNLFSIFYCALPIPPTPHPLSLLSPFLLFTCITLPSRSPSPLQATEKEKESPVELTERCFRELLGRAAYGNIKNAVTPVLMWVSWAASRLLICRWCIEWTLKQLSALVKGFNLCIDWPKRSWQGQHKVDCSD